jgi:hypothetical protein
LPPLTPSVIAQVLLLISVGPGKTRLMDCSHPRLIVLNRVLVPHSSAEALHVERRERPLFAKGGIIGQKWPVKFSVILRLSHHCTVL